MSSLGMNKTMVMGFKTKNDCPGYGLQNITALPLSLSLQKKQLISDADGFMCQHLVLLKPG
jgi:hypothetical protein